MRLLEKPMCVLEPLEIIQFEHSDKPPQNMPYD